MFLVEKLKKFSSFILILPRKCLELSTLSKLLPCFFHRGAVRFQDIWDFILIFYLKCSLTWKWNWCPPFFWYVMNFMLSSFIVVFSVKSARNLHISSILMVYFSLIGLSNVLKAYYLPLLLSEMYPSLPLKELITAFDVIFIFIFVILCFMMVGWDLLFYYSSLLFFIYIFILKYFYFIFISVFS